jgi:hypothetical protein
VANLCLGAIERLRGFLVASDGINAALMQISARDGVHLPALSAQTILAQNVASDLADENLAVIYPAVHVYCDRMDNQQLEKFRKFSGRLLLAAEVRVSREQIAGLDQELARYMEAVAAVLGAHHGQWTENVAYGGGYEVQFRETRLGGRNFIATAKVEIELQAHE